MKQSQKKSNIKEADSSKKIHNDDYQNERLNPPTDNGMDIEDSNSVSDDWEDEEIVENASSD